MGVKEDIFKITRYELEDIYLNKIDLNSIRIRGPYSNKEEIISKLRSQPMTIVNQIVPYIKTVEIEEDTSIDTDDDFRELYTINIYDHIQVKLFSVITSIYDLEYRFKDCDGVAYSDYELGIKAEIEYYSNHSGDIRIKGKYTRPDFQPEMTLLDLDSCLQTKITCTVNGLLREDDIPSWVYYLIEGCVNYDDDNNNIAVFNIFAALDNFIEDMNSEILDYYLIKYNEILEYVETEYPNDREKYLEAKNYLQDKIKKYCRDTRRLEEKLKDVMSEVGIKGDNPKFQKLCNMYKTKFKEIERYRNKIAHGELCNHNELDFAECLYFILTVILSILHVYDFEKDEWQGMIEEYQFNY